MQGCMAVLAAVLAWPAAAQDLSLGSDLSPKSMMADQLVVLSRASLGRDGSVRPDQFARAAVLLDLSLEQNPQNAEVWRLRGELAQQMNDPAGHLAALRKYSALEPADDAAQLDLILRIVQPLQTLEQRITTVERLLESPDAQRFSAPLRSRLASFIAASAREMGDQPRFAKWLRAAVTLDSTNQYAAQLTYEFVVSRGGSPVEVGAALMSLVSADPLAPQPRRLLAGLLVSQGAYEDAAVQYNASSNVGAQADLGSDYLWVLSLATLGRFDDALALLDQLEQYHNTGPTGGSSGAAATGPSATTAPGPQTGAATTTTAATSTTPRLPIELEMLRLAILHQTGHTAPADASFTRLRTMLQDRIAAGETMLRLDLAWVCVFFGREFDLAKNQLQAAGAVSPSLTPLVQRIRGYMAMHEGQTDQARALLAPLAAKDPFAAYGLAQTFSAGDPEARRKQLTELYQAAPASLPAMLAVRDLAAAGQRVEPLPAGAALASAMDRWPGVLTSPDLRQVPWTLLDMRIEPLRYGYLEPITARLTLRNGTDLPLSLAGGTLPTQLFIVISPRIAGQSGAELPPLVVDIGRRLRLSGRGTLEVPVRLDYSDLGSLLATVPTHPVRFVALAILDPRVSTRGISPGPVGATDSVNLIERRGLPPTPANIDQWLAALDEVDVVEKWAALATLAQIAPQMQGESAAEQSKKIAAAVNQRFAQLDGAAQAWFVRFLPNTPKAQELFGPVHDLAQRSNDVLMRVVYLATQVSDVQSPLFDAAARHSDARVGRFAKALRTGLEEEAKAKAATQPAAQP